MKFTSVQLDPWKWQGVVLIGGDGPKAKAWAKRAMGYEPNIGEYAAGHAYLESGKPWFLWVDSERNIPALAHEALHITAGVLEGRGLSFANASEEAYTYTMEHIIREVMSCKRWKKVRG